MVAKNREYPHILATHKGIDPRTVSPDRYGHFIMIPRFRADEVHWGFEDESGRDLFAIDYKEKVL